MIEIDYIQISEKLYSLGYKRMQKYIFKACKNIAAGQPYRVINKPGDRVTKDGEIFIVTAKGRLCRI